MTKVFARTKGLIDVPNHYCPGCGHGIVHRLVAEVLEEMDLLDHTAVSYTHLDVYKRQIVISGRGYGHGVGLSQFGAIAMGDDGYTWDEIIEHYFCSDNGIELVKAY